MQKFNNNLNIIKYFIYNAFQLKYFKKIEGKKTFGLYT
jgi:hypothetical protein